MRLIIIHANMSVGGVSRGQLRSVAVSYGQSWSVTVSRGQLRSVAVSHGQSRSVTVSRGQLRSVTVSRGQLRSVAVSYDQSRSVTVSCGQLWSVAVSYGQSRSVSVSRFDGRRGREGGIAGGGDLLRWMMRIGGSFQISIVFTVSR